MEKRRKTILYLVSVGKKYLEYSNKSFASSTAWTERTGFVAASAMIDFFVKKKVNQDILKIGNKIKKGWLKLAKKNNLILRVSEVTPLCTFFLDYHNKEELYTLFTKEMLKKKIIASNSIYVSYSHKSSDVDKYLKICDKVFAKISKFIAQKKKIKKSEIRYSGFARLTKN